MCEREQEQTLEQAVLAPGMCVSIEAANAHANAIGAEAGAAGPVCHRAGSISTKIKYVTFPKEPSTMVVTPDA